MNITPTYDIDAPVYHVCDGNVKGKVIDWRYFRRENYFEYLVTFGTGICRMWLAENELLKADK
jgi:hypothetical protein